MNILTKFENGNLVQTIRYSRDAIEQRKTDPKQLMENVYLKAYLIALAKRFNNYDLKK